MNENLTKNQLLADLCERFIRDQRITCAETIYQTDWVILNAYELIEAICDICGYVRLDGDDDEDDDL